MRSKSTQLIAVLRKYVPVTDKKTLDYIQPRATDWLQRSDHESVM